MGEDVIVIGGGQAGLAAAYHLTQQGLSPLVLDAGPGIGTSWRRRWDSLHTFTSARSSALPGLPFPGGPDRFPSKDEVADYLASYAAHFDLRVQVQSRVRSLRVVDDGFALDVVVGERDVFGVVERHPYVVRRRAKVHARRVVVAAGAFGARWTPPLAGASTVRQVHAAEYRNPEQLPGQKVLVVGAGNSGIQIARELAAAGREVTVSRGRPMVELPQQLYGRDIFWWMDRFGVMDMPVAPPPPDAPVGADPVVGDHLAALDVQLVGRVATAVGDEVVTTTGETLHPDLIVWATGYRHDWAWLDKVLLNDDGVPRHEAGVGAVEGSYFIGLHRLRSRGSALTGFVGRDAARLAEHLAASAFPAAVAA